MSKLKELELLLNLGKITRREFIAKASALGLTVALSPALFSAKARAAAPKKGGLLKLGCQGATTDSLDPATMNDTIPISMNWSLRNCLVEVDYKGEAIPELAESWESTPDAAKWTFTLRKGVEFHNGKPLEVKDVMHSIQHHRGEKSKSAVKSILEQIKEIKADDKHVVTFVLEAGNADFPYIMSDYHLAIFPDGTSVTDLEKGIGTGGYILVNHEPGVRATLKRNPNYWKKGRAHFDKLEYIVINDVNARTNALKTKQIDVMNRCDLKTVHLLGRMPGIKINNVQGYRHFIIPMLCDKAPYNDNNVRMALKLAVDREDLVKRILRGYGSVGNDIPIAANQKFFASEIPQREYDPDKAKYLIKKAGQQNHVFKLHTSGAAFAGANDTAVLYKEYAKKAGINIDVVQEPVDGYWDDVWMKKEWIMSYWSGRATVDWMFSTAYSKDAKWNETHWYNDRFNKLLKEARGELNEAKRKAMYLEMQQIVRDDGGAVIPMFSNWVEAVSDKVQIGNPAGNWELDGLRCTERWWFA
jgi:peptide/nickel transport system substrate-binding protein